MKIGALVSALVLLATAVLPAQASGPEAEELARTLVRAQLPVQVFDGLYDAVSAAMTEQLRAAFEPDLGRPFSAEEASQMRRFWAAKMAELLPYDSVVESAAAAMREKLTAEEMREIVDVYRSPAFSKVIASAGSVAGGLIPEAMQQMESTGGIGDEAKDRIMEEAAIRTLQQASRQLTDEELGFILRFSASPLGRTYAELAHVLTAGWEELAGEMASRAQEPGWLQRTVLEMLAGMPTLLGSE